MISQLHELFVLYIFDIFHSSKDKRNPYSVSYAGEAFGAKSLRSRHS